MQVEPTPSKTASKSSRIDPYLLAAFVIGSNAFSALMVYDTAASNVERILLDTIQLVALPILAIASAVLGFFAVRKNSFMLAVLAVLAPLFLLLLMFLKGLVGALLIIPYLMFEFGKAGL